MRLSPFEKTVYAAAIGALVAAKADDLLKDGSGLAHQLSDVAMDQVNEARVLTKASRMRRRKARR